MVEHWHQMGGAIATRNDELKMYTWDNEHIAHIEAALRTAQRAMRLITAGGLVCSTEPLLFSSPRDKADVITVLIKPDRVAQGSGPGARGPGPRTGGPTGGD
jgi:hypothetical protein